MNLLHLYSHLGHAFLAMKKIASVITLFIGLVLLGLNYTTSVKSELSESFSSKPKATVVKQTTPVGKSFDVTKINLPSIFDALIRSL